MRLGRKGRCRSITYAEFRISVLSLDSIVIVRSHVDVSRGRDPTDFVYACLDVDLFISRHRRHGEELSPHLETKSMSYVIIYSISFLLLPSQAGENFKQGQCGLRQEVVATANSPDAASRSKDDTGLVMDV